MAFSFARTQADEGGLSMLETTRLTLRPASREEMEALIAAMDDIQKGVDAHAQRAD